MPISTSNITGTINILEYFNSIDYREFIINFSYVYYLTIFFLLIRILIYFGVSFVNLINIKYSTFVKTHNTRFFFTFFMKFYKKSSIKQIVLKLIAVTCL